MISMIELLVLIVGGWLIFRLVKGRHGQRRGGGIMKVLGMAAIVAGIAVFWIHPGQHVEVDYSPAVPVTVFDDDFLMDLNPGENMRPVQIQTFRADGPPRWVFISLGAGLVILGALMFGRGGERPVALKAVTLLGVGAILYAVVTFLGQAPRRSTNPVASRVIRVEHGPRDTDRAERPARRHSHAKRPALRPLRPAEVTWSGDELPPRAGGIPVSVELERQASSAALKEAPPAEPAAEPAPAAKPAPATPPEPAEPSADAQDSEPVEPDAEPEVAQAPAEPAETLAEEQAPEPPEPEPAPAAETAEPAVPSKTKVARPAKRTEEATGSIDEVVSANEPRPDWIDALPDLDHGIYSLSVRSGRFVTLPECQRELDRQIKVEADHYINEYLGDEATALVDIPLAYLKDQVKKAEYVEVVQPKELQDYVGHMYEIHALLEFDDAARSDFRRQWRNAEVVNRLWYTGGAAALVLALLGTFYGYLKLDLRTGGAHKGRLQLAATLVALIAAAGILLVRWAVPF